MPAFSQMKGARLEFVVREIKGKIKRPIANFNPKTKKIEYSEKTETAGYMVYTPSGSYRLNAKELVQRGFDRQPKVLNLDQVTDTESPAGRFKYAITEEQRAKAWRMMEDNLIRSSQRRTGPTEKETIHEA